MPDKYPTLAKRFEPDLLKEILSLPINKFTKGTMFDGETNSPDSIPLILKGTITVSNVDDKGRRYSLYTINEGESCIIAINAIINSSFNFGQDSYFEEDTEVVIISAEQSKLWVDKYKSWRTFIFELYGKRLKELIKQHETVVEQRDQISQKNRNINDSIRYARRIQKAVMPSNDYMQDILPDYFIINKPRDIVSGDFYWVGQHENKLVVVAADSTGHGVPGALMSILGISLLNEITQNQEKLGAGLILTELRSKIKKMLNQTGEKDEQKDGYDMAICLIDLKSNKLEYAGAYNPLYLIRNKELIEIKADKMPVGIHIKEKSKFTTHETTLLKDDLIYMFSDGYVDQFGGSEGKKFKIKPFKELLLAIQDRTISEQKELLTEVFDTWKGDIEQVDDVLVFGIKI